MLALSLYSNRRSKDLDCLTCFDGEDYKIIDNATEDKKNAVSALFEHKAFVLSFLHYATSEEGKDFA